jgi:4-hydroxymandelate oxidase
MYRSVPPALGAGTAPLRISGAARRVFDGQAEAARHPAYRTYLTDMVRPYGLGVDAEALDAGRGQSYGDMAGALIAEVAAEDQPADLLVMAFAVPDVTPWRCTAAHLSQLCPGGPMAFAVSDCGTTAGFTGLRLIRAQAAGLRAARALLIVVEQAAINHELPGPASVPARHAAVALRCDQAGPALVDSVRLRQAVASREVAGLLATGLAELSAGHDDVTVIAGADLAAAAGAAALPPAAEVVVGPAGQPSTGVWWEVAGRLDGWAAQGRRVLVADYDRLAGGFCLAAIDVTAPSPASA